MENEILRIRDLHTSFFTRNGEVKAVNGVSLDVPPASVVGIVGESGCGKSMTARSIMGLVKYPGRVAGGSIELCSRELVGLSDREMCRLRGDEMSMIFQEPMTSLNPVVPVGKQVEEAVLLHRKVSRAEARSEALRMFERVGIPEPEKRLRAYPHELSGGLRQRVMIAMAMVCRPKLLIADEPTTALDVTVQAQILKLMRELRDETGMSIILISHDLGVIAELCDFVYVMYAGRIVEQAEVCELFDNPMHPYTRGLLRSVSALERGGERLDTIPGVVPNLLRLPASCAFSLRCGECSEDCAARLPELVSVNGTHLVRCHMAGGENRGQ
jgi:oligopeptide/dipeptide ABC transporter ATP-binding protein